MSDYYQEYQLMTREEKLSYLHKIFHEPNTLPEHLEIIHKEFKKVLHQENLTSQEPLGSTIYP